MDWSTPQLMNTVASDGDHCKSSTDPLCSLRPTGSTPHRNVAPAPAPAAAKPDPSAGCHTWIFPAQSPVASQPGATYMCQVGGTRQKMHRRNTQAVMA